MYFISDRLTDPELLLNFFSIFFFFPDKILCLVWFSRGREIYVYLLEMGKRFTGLEDQPLNLLN